MLLSPLRYINPISGNRGGSAGFSIAKSFYLDGVDEYFNADDVYTNNSTDTVGTLSVVVKSVDILPSAVSFIVTFARSTTDLSSTGISQKTTGEVQITYVNSSSVKWVVVTDNPIDLTSWTKIDLVQDGVLPIIYINGVAVAQTTTVSTNTTLWLNDVVLDNFRIGQQDRTGGTTYDFNGYVSQVSYLNTNISAAQILDLYNNGKPKNPQSLFGANCKYFFNPDNSGDTAQFTVTDSTNSITATSVNMEDADKTTETPY